MSKPRSENIVIVVDTTAIQEFQCNCVGKISFSNMVVAADIPPVLGEKYIIAEAAGSQSTVIMPITDLQGGVYEYVVDMRFYNE